MKINTASKIILTTYVLAELLLLLFCVVYFLVLKNIADWEMLTYNFYGSMAIFGLSCLASLILRLIFKISNKVVLCILVFVLPEIMGWFASGNSLYISALKNNTSYLLMYPVSIIVAFSAIVILLKNRRVEVF